MNRRIILGRDKKDFQKKQHKIKLMDFWLVFNEIIKVMKVRKNSIELKHYIHYAILK